MDVKSRIDPQVMQYTKNNTATYKLFETIEERLQRVEKKY